MYTNESQKAITYTLRNFLFLPLRINTDAHVLSWNPKINELVEINLKNLSWVLG